MCRTEKNIFDGNMYRKITKKNLPIVMKQSKCLVDKRCESQKFQIYFTNVLEFSQRFNNKLCVIKSKLLFCLSDQLFTILLLRPRFAQT